MKNQLFYFLFYFSCQVLANSLRKKGGAKMGSLIWRQMNSVKALTEVVEKPLPDTIEGNDMLDNSIHENPNPNSEPEASKAVSTAEMQKKAMDDLSELKTLIESKREGGTIFRITQ